VTQDVVNQGMRFLNSSHGAMVATTAMCTVKISTQHCYEPQLVTQNSLYTAFGSVLLWLAYWSARPFILTCNVNLHAEATPRAFLASSEHVTSLHFFRKADQHEQGCTAAVKYKLLVRCAMQHLLYGTCTCAQNNSTIYSRSCCSKYKDVLQYPSHGSAQCTASTLAILNKAKVSDSYH